MGVQLWGSTLRLKESPRRTLRRSEGWSEGMIGNALTVNRATLEVELAWTFDTTRE
jgi:hypothetical protein